MDVHYLAAIEQMYTEIESLLRRAKRKENILFVGETGAGKSSLKNSITESLAERWEPEAQVGQQMGDATPITDRIKWYRNCSVDPGDNTRLKSHLLPNLIDMAGYSGQDLDKWKEILTAIVDGRLPDNSNLTELLARLDRNPRYLDVLNVDESRKITKIVYIASACETVNSALIDMVMDVAQPTDGSNRLIHVYGALTNCDRVRRGGDRSITQSEFDVRRAAFIRLLRIENVENDYFSEITNFSSLTLPGNLEVRCVLLNFLQKLLVNKAEPHSQNPLRLSMRQKFNLMWLENSKKDVFLYAMIILLVAIVIMFLL